MVLNNSFNNTTKSFVFLYTDQIWFMTFFLTIHLNFNGDLTQFRAKIRAAVKKIAQKELMGIFFLRYYGVYWFTRTKQKLSFTFFLQNSHYHQTMKYSWLYKQKKSRQDASMPSSVTFIIFPGFPYSAGGSMRLEMLVAAVKACVVCSPKICRNFVSGR